jgi:hypothetical protein
VKPPTPAGGWEESMCAVAAFFLRRRKNHTPAPTTARPSIGPATAPAIHALEPDSGSGVCAGATWLVEDVPGDGLMEVSDSELAVVLLAYIIT